MSSSTTFGEAGKIRWNGAQQFVGPELEYCEIGALGELGKDLTGDVTSGERKHLKGLEVAIGCWDQAREVVGHEVQMLQVPLVAETLRDLARK